MKRILRYLFLLPLFSGPFFTFGQTAQTSLKWKLVWHDEFNYSGFPDSSKWGYRTGFGGAFHQEYFTKGRSLNAKVINGSLVITARKENYRNPEYKRGKYSDYPRKFLNKTKDSIPSYVKMKYDSVFHYTSASITSKGKASWLHGRIEIRAKLPAGKGTSCGIWMLRKDNGSNKGQTPWPKSGEIDIVESIGRVSDKISSAVHFVDSGGLHKQDVQKLSVQGLSTGFHVYAMEWDRKEIKFFCDGQLYHTFLISKSAPYFPFEKPFYLIMDISLGLKNWSGTIDDSTLPQQMVIDYVRIYQKK